MKSQTARVVLIRSVAPRLAVASQHWDQRSNLDSVQKAAASICGLRFSKSIRTGRAGALLRRLPERALRPRRLANVHQDKFANNQQPRRRTSKASPSVGKTACKKQQSHCWWLRVPKETMVPTGCDRMNRKTEWSAS